jgi:hypothetical protein
MNGILLSVAVLSGLCVYGRQPAPSADVGHMERRKTGVSSPASYPSCSQACPFARGRPALLKEAQRSHQAYLSLCNLKALHLRNAPLIEDPELGVEDNSPEDEL